jgi:hypothetical protein
MGRDPHQQVFSTGAWWDIDEVTPGVFRRSYMAAEDAYFEPPPSGPEEGPPPGEVPRLLLVFNAMLREVSADGARKRRAGMKPPWWRDPAHEGAIYSHLAKWKRGQRRDMESGAHPLVHLAWRALAIAYQETYGQVDPEKR